MRIRRAAVLFTLALVAACSSEEQLNPQPLPPEDQEGVRSPTPGGGASADNSLCSGTCCTKPAEGSSCQAGSDSTCSWAVTCPNGGLVLPYELTCVNGVWQLTNGCPAEGETDARGCPTRQPENGTACNATPSSQCGYVLECTGYRKSAIAQCFNQTQGGTTWSTTPLGTCD